MPFQENCAQVTWTEQTRSAYENWYAIVHHPTELKAFWFRYTLLARKDAPPEARLWAAYFDEEDYVHYEVSEKQFFTTQSFPFQIVSCKPDGGISIGDHFITHQEASGTLQHKEKEISWHFHWEPAPQTRYPVHEYKLYRLFSKSFHCSPNAHIRMNGTLKIGKESLSFENAPAHQGHTFGTQMPLGWIWSECGTFEESPDAYFEGIALYKKKSHPHPPALNSFFFHFEGQDYFFNHLRQLYQNKSQGTLPLWNFEAVSPKLTLKGQMRLRAAKFAQVAYLTPDRKLLFNHNDCLAQIELHLYAPKSAKPFKTLTSTKASLEFVFREGSRSDFYPKYDDL